jgi:alpha-beta hydrolase superfamily lysophospholipase
MRMPINVAKLRDEYESLHHKVTTSDGLTLFLREWRPAPGSEKETAILILHGITAYSGPYAMIGEPLAENGFTTYGMDLRGHGLSDGDRGDSPGRDVFIRDLCETISFVREKHSKLVLLGHSLGVLSAILAINGCSKPADGAIFLSAAKTMREGVSPELSLSKKLGILFRSLASPSKPVVEYRREGMVGLDDPLFTFNYSLRFMRIAGFRDLSFPEELAIPVFVGIGDSDEYRVQSMLSFLPEAGPGLQNGWKNTSLDCTNAKSVHLRTQ